MRFPSESVPGPHLFSTQAKPSPALCYPQWPTERVGRDSWLPCESTGLQSTSFSFQMEIHCASLPTLPSAFASVKERRRGASSNLAAHLGCLPGTQLAPLTPISWKSPWSPGPWMPPLTWMSGTGAPLPPSAHYCVTLKFCLTQSLILMVDQSTEANSQYLCIRRFANTYLN